MRKKVKSFSIVYDKRQREIQSPVKISSDKRRLKRRSVKCVATWDTGATSTVISERVAKLLDLQPIGATKVFTANGSVLRDICMVRISLGHGISKVLEATTADLGPLDALIGMDIIGDGEFAISSDSSDGRMCLSYRAPSTRMIKLD